MSNEPRDAARDKDAAADWGQSKANTELVRELEHFGHTTHAEYVRRAYQEGRTDGFEAGWHAATDQAWILIPSTFEEFAQITVGDAWWTRINGTVVKRSMNYQDVECFEWCQEVFTAYMPIIQPSPYQQGETDE